MISPNDIVTVTAAELKTGDRIFTGNHWLTIAEIETDDRGVLYFRIGKGAEYTLTGVYAAGPADTIRSIPMARTLNERYDRVRSAWSDTTPTCEECEGDMTGSNVNETRHRWICDECFAIEEDELNAAAIAGHYPEDFHADI